MAIGFDRAGPRAFALRCAVSALLVSPAIDPASAQAPLPPPPAQVPQAQAPQAPMSTRNPVCVRLEAQLAAVERGEGDGRAEQIRRYEEAANRQQQELDRMIAQARQAGCGGSGFFLFGGGQPPQCDRINNQIQRMRHNLDRILTGLRQLQGSGNDREEQRRAILISLSQYDCGPQYRSAAAPPRPRGFFETIFGGTQSGGTVEAPVDTSQNATFRTLCVRTCDGFFFPISNSTGQARFQDDERTCQRVCPAAEVMLFTHRNPGEDVSRAVSVSGQPYTSLPNAFKYRQEFNAACTCKRAGETWAQAVSEDPTVARGDIVVTEENAKTVLQQKPEPPPRPASPARLRGRERTGATPPSPSETAAAQPAPRQSTTGTADPPAAPPRSVGPQFYR